MKALRFDLKSTCSVTAARRGQLVTGRGTVETPVFMPVGTVGSVKGIAPWTLKNLGAEIILGNTYHLHLRPGESRIEALGGLQRFTAWDKPMLTDSGGFQVFSLASLNQISERGVKFQSHIDGSHRFLSPESSMEIQNRLGADIVMAFDQCPPATATREEVIAATQRTTRWLDRCMEAFNREDQALFGIVQGGLHEDLRRAHAEELSARDLPGYALGGFSVGEAPAVMVDLLQRVTSTLPKAKPRYLMGVGTPRDLVEAVATGVDMFDCVLPTRNGRMGTVFTSEGRLNIKNARFADDQGPLDPNCACRTCSTYSRAYLRHLFVTKELLGLSALTEHNLFFYLDLMRQIRVSISENRFLALLESVRSLWPLKA